MSWIGPKKYGNPIDTREFKVTSGTEEKLLEQKL
jgi:hypothetical protein